MSERENRNTDQDKQTQESLKPTQDFLRRHRSLNLPLNALYMSAFYAYGFLNPRLRDVMKDPEIRRLLTDREAQVGLLEDSIFAPSLYHPSADETSMEYTDTVAGRWVGYDFHRATDFGPRVKERGRQLFEGRITTYPLEEVLRNDVNTHTSSYLLHPFSFPDFHIFQESIPTIEDLLSYGFIEESTYAESYDRAGQYPKYRKQMAIEGILDLPIYRVTPKGNTLVVISGDFGKRKKEPEKDSVRQSIFDRRLQPQLT